MNNLQYVFQFFNTIVSALNSINVPGFNFTFWDFSVGSFMLASGIAFIRYMMGVHRTEDSGDKK